MVKINFQVGLVTIAMGVDRKDMIEYLVIFILLRLITTLGIFF